MLEHSYIHLEPTNQAKVEQALQEEKKYGIKNRRCQGIVRLTLYLAGKTS